MMYRCFPMQITQHCAFFLKSLLFHIRLFTARRVRLLSVEWTIEISYHNRHSSLQRS